MKLHTKYNRIAIASSLLVLIIAGLGYYFILHYILIKQLDETLSVEEIEILDYVKKNRQLPGATTFHDQRISFQKTAGFESPKFQTILLQHSEGVKELTRQLTFTIDINGTLYKASVTKSQEATEKLMAVILLVTIVLIVLLGCLLFFANRTVLKTLWKPFRTTLLAIKQFDLNKPSQLNLQNTSIDEFNELQETVRMMTQKVFNDYQSLKSFTDQASHEMQTPLAVITSKLDMIIQTPQLSKENHQQLQGIYNAVERLSKLSQSLLLLTKIENNQFNEIQHVNVQNIIKNKINDVSEWIKTKNMVIDDQTSPIFTEMHPQLAEILVSNLVNNALRHSTKGSGIMLKTSDRSFIISNTGDQLLDKDYIFGRFFKAGHSDGTGLGLAICKQICDHYGFNLTYYFAGKQHHFKIMM